MAQHPWFKDWFNSHYYHELYAHRDDTEAAAFIDKLIDYLKPQAGATMLDVACGKGRHSIHLAAKGYDVTGIDLSEESINEALHSQSDTLHFYTHDMRLPFWINYFDYAFNFFTSFGYFKTKREHNNAIRTMAQAIKSNGYLVIDYLNTKYSEGQMVPGMEKEINGVQYSITKWHDDKYFYKRIVVNDKAMVDGPQEYTEQVAKFSLANFREMLEQQGMQVKEVFGD
ncbi:MAG: methyltransferase domain-containing protein, partial [Sphingobacteriales bacterium]|nr:methyltransferase domain-containing protein [Sphingobacteriales bacterium]